MAVDSSNLQHQKKWYSFFNNKMKVINQALSFRDEQEKLYNQSELDLGDFTTLNLTLLKGGVQYNVVPQTIIAGFDIRISPKFGIQRFENLLKEWTKE